MPFHALRPLPVAALLLAALPAFAAPEPEPEVKSGTVSGKVAELGDHNTFVVVDAANKRWRFMPEWKKEDKGFDKEIVKAIRGLKKDDRVTVAWKFFEHYRALKIEKAKD